MMVKFRLRLERNLLERARKLASMEGKSVEDFIVDLLRSLIEANDTAKRETRKPKAIR
jgi:predicted HicB family RNase H-like nuclease